MLGNKLLNIQFAKYHIWNNKSEGFPNMVLSTETFNQSVRTENSEAVNVPYTFQPLWVSGNSNSNRTECSTIQGVIVQVVLKFQAQLPLNCMAQSPITN